MSPSRRYLSWLMTTPVVVAVVCSAYVELFPLNVFGVDYPQWVDVMDFAERPESDGVMILGDSRAKAAIVPRVLGPSARSLAIVGSGPIQTYFTFGDLLAAGGRPEAIVIGYAPKHFYRAHNVFWYYTAKYKFLSAREAFEVGEEARRLDDWVLGDPRIFLPRWIATRANALPLYLPELVKSLLAPRRRANDEELRRLRTARGHGRFGEADSSNGLVPEARQESFRASPLLDVYFGRTLELARREGVAVFYATMPINASTDAALSPNFREAYIAYLRGWAERYPEFAIDTRVPVLPNDHFGDASHVNARGAQVVSEELRQVIRRWRGALPPRGERHGAPGTATLRLASSNPA
jgi:hypothetical protein